MRWCYLLHRLLSSPFNVYHLNFLSDFAISAPSQRAARGGRSSQSFRFSFEHEQKLQLSNHHRRRCRHHHYTTVFCIYWILTSADGVLLSPPPHTHTIIWRRQGLSVTGRIYGKWVRCWIDADATGNYDDDDDENDDDVTVDIWHYIVVWIRHHIHQIEPNHTSIHSSNHWVWLESPTFIRLLHWFDTQHMLSINNITTQ